MSRILLVTNIFPPDIGGPATFIDHLGFSLAQHGHSVTVVCTSDQPRDSSDRRRPFRVRRIHRRNRLVIEVMSRLVLAQEMLRHHNILVNGLEYQAAQVAARLGRRYILKIVGDSVWELARNTGLSHLSIDDFQTVTPTESLLRTRIGWRQQFLRQARQIITPSHYLRQMVIGWGVAADNVQVILNGIPLDEYAAFKPHPRATDVLLVGFCGRLTNWKGVETLLLAVADLPQVQVNIMGDGPELPMLQGLAEQLNLVPRVHFLGRLLAQPLRKVLSQVDVLALPSMYEGLSHTLLEASAMGLACLASDRGGNPEVITSGVDGVLVPYGAVKQLKNALEQLYDDEPFRYRLASLAKENSLRFNFRNTVTQTTEILLRQ